MHVHVYTVYIYLPYCTYVRTYTKYFPADCNGIQHTSTAVTGSGSTHLSSICIHYIGKGAISAGFNVQAMNLHYSLRCY